MIIGNYQGIRKVKNIGRIYTSDRIEKKNKKLAMREWKEWEVICAKVSYICAP